jgi:hypothetical protein
MIVADLVFCVLLQHGDKQNKNKKRKQNRQQS